MKHFPRFLLVLLAVCLLCSCLVCAEGAEENSPPEAPPTASEPFDSIPAGWSHDALLFAVRNGLMSADALEPARPATRAELAKMLVTLFRPAEDASLDAFSDVDPAAWYTPYLAKAVQMGVLTGSNGKLAPNDVVTREQACAMLSRAFGLAGGCAADLTAFSDYPSVSSWAVSSVGAMVRADYLHGSGGKLRPQDTISREELAQLLYNLTGAVAVTPDELPQSGCVLLLEPGERLMNKTVDGDLILSCQAPQALTLQNLQISGRIVIHGASEVTLQNVQAGAVALCEPGSLTIQTSTIGDVLAMRDGALVNGRCDRLIVAADTSYTCGTAQTALLCGGALSIASGATVQKAEILPNAAGAALAVDGRVNELTISARDAHVTGTGVLASAVVHKPGAAIETADTRIQETLDAGLSGVTVSAELVEPTPEQPVASFRYTFDGVSTDYCTGSEMDVRYCSVQLLIDGAVVKTLPYVPLQTGYQLSLTHTFSYRKGMKNDAQITLRVLYDGETITESQKIALHNYDDAYYDELAKKSWQENAKKVSTIQVEATVRYQTSLYANMGLSGYLRTLPAGTTAIYDCYNGTYAGRIRLSDGTVGWVSLNALDISTKNYVISDYSTEVKEAFVNYHGYESSTSLLVWVSLKTQKVNVFHREGDVWKLEKTFSVCSGKNATPTIAGVFKYSSRQDMWDFGSYYVNRPMIFNGGHAFHSRTYVKSTGDLLDPTIGRPASHGCIRMYDEDVNWLWNNMQFGTTVVVF